MQQKGLITIFFVIAAIVSFHTAWSTKREGERWWFTLRRNPTVPKDTAYGSIPMAIGCLVAAIGITLDNRGLFLLGLVGGVALAFVFMMWKPDWLKPNWLLWLENHYGPELTKRMLQRGQVPPSTQEELEAWAEKMTWGDKV